MLLFLLFLVIPASFLLFALFPDELRDYEGYFAPLLLSSFLLAVIALLFPVLPLWFLLSLAVIIPLLLAKGPLLVLYLLAPLPLRYATENALSFIGIGFLLIGLMAGSAYLLSGLKKPSLRTALLHALLPTCCFLVGSLLLYWISRILSGVTLG